MQAVRVRTLQNVSVQTIPKDAFTCPSGTRTHASWLRCRPSANPHQDLHASIGSYDPGDLARCELHRGCLELLGKPLNVEGRLIFRCIAISLLRHVEESEVLFDSPLNVSGHSQRE